jgi:hypothetical protein
MHVSYCPKDLSRQRVAACNHDEDEDENEGVELASVCVCVLWWLLFC